MIVRFFRTGQSSGEAPVNYLLRSHDHAGELRAERPEILEGNPKLTIRLINGVARQHKYASGCLAFRLGEQPSKAELHAIIDRFKAVVAPGLDPDQFNSLFVLHREPPDRKTGLSGMHVHFVMPMTILAGTTLTGKDLTGRRWNPHPPGKQTIETMALFAQVTNHEHGWAQVTERRLRVGVDSFWLKAGNTSNAKKAELLRKELSKAVRSGQINSRDELCSFLDQSLGLTITRVGTDYVSVKFPNGVKAVRLKGAMFDCQTDYATLRAATSQSHGTERLSVPAYQEAKARLACLLSSRASELIGTAIPKLPRTITTKENNYGTDEKRLRRNHDGRAQLGRSDALHVPARGLERDLFQESAGQWRHPNDGDAQKSDGRPQKADASGQHPVHTLGSHAAGQWEQLGWCTPSSFEHAINEEIAALNNRLSDCELGSSHIQDIGASIDALVRQRELQPNRPKIRRR